MEGSKKPLILWSDVAKGSNGRAKIVAPDALIFIFFAKPLLASEFNTISLASKTQPLPGFEQDDIDTFLK